MKKHQEPQTQIQVFLPASLRLSFILIFTNSLLSPSQEQQFLSAPLGASVVMSISPGPPGPLPALRSYPSPTVPWGFAFSACKTSSVIHYPALVSGHLLILKSAKGHCLSSREERETSECSQVWDWISNMGQSSRQHRYEHIPTGHCSGCLDISVSRTAYRFFSLSI